MLVLIPKPLVLIEIMNKMDECSLDGVQLLKIIARKMKMKRRQAGLFAYLLKSLRARSISKLTLLQIKMAMMKKLLLRPFNVLSIRFGFIPLLT